MRSFLPFFTLIVLVTPATLFAQEAEQQQLQDIEDKIDDSKDQQIELKNKAAKVAQDGQRIAKQLVDIAARIQDLEENITNIEISIFALTGEIADKKEAVRQQNIAMSHTLAALQRLSQRPPEYIIMRPAEAEETVRSASLLTAALPAIAEKTAEMRTGLDQLSALKSELNADQETLRQDLVAMQSERRALTVLQTEKRALYSDYNRGIAQEKARSEALAREARDLQSLIEKLEQDLLNSAHQALPTPPIPPGTSFAKAKGRLPFPARGTIIQSFGDKIAVGNAQGIDIKARSGAQVIAPFDGRIIFAGEFRAYGNLLIIAHGEGYHSLLAGLGTINASVGEWVLAGEPVGVMPEVKLASTNSNTAGAFARLYLEIRKGGDPVNPRPWLTK